MSEGWNKCAEFFWFPRPPHIYFQSLPVMFDSMPPSSPIVPLSACSESQATTGLATMSLLIAEPKWESACLLIWFLVNFSITVVIRGGVANPLHSILRVERQRFPSTVNFQLFQFFQQIISVFSHLRYKLFRFCCNAMTTESHGEFFLRCLLTPST